MDDVRSRVFTGLFLAFCVSLLVLGVYRPDSDAAGQKGGKGGGGGDGGFANTFNAFFRSDDAVNCGNSPGTDHICSDGGPYLDDAEAGVDAHFTLEGNFSLNPDENPSTRPFVFNFDEPLPPPAIPSLPPGPDPIFVCDSDIDFGDESGNGAGDGLCNIFEVDFANPEVQAGFNYFFGASTLGLACDGTTPDPPIPLIDMADGDCLRAIVSFQFSWTKKKLGGQLWLRAGNNGVLAHQGTDDVRVECTVAQDIDNDSVEECITWELTSCGPAGNPCEPGRQKLRMRLLESTAKGNSGPEHVGDFNMPFKLRMERVLD